MSSETPRQYWNLRTFCVVTGASRGIGQEIAVQFAQKLKPGSLVLLLARSEKGLQHTKQWIENATKSVTVKAISFDLSAPDNDVYFDLLSKALTDHNVKPSDFEHALIVHNAATLIRELSLQSSLDVKRLHAYMDTNLFSTMCLTAQFLKLFPAKSVAKRSIVHISSMASQLPSPFLGVYSMGKTARNMYFSTVALEDPTIDVFSYGPGPVFTDMLMQASEIERDNLRQAAEDGKILTPEKSAAILVDILEKGDYKPGEFRDAFTPEQYGYLLDNAGSQLAALLQ